MTQPTIPAASYESVAGIPANDALAQAAAGAFSAQPSASGVPSPLIPPTTDLQSRTDAAQYAQGKPVVNTSLPQGHEAVYGWFLGQANPRTFGDSTQWDVYNGKRESGVFWKSFISKKGNQCFVVGTKGHISMVDSEGSPLTRTYTNKDGEEVTVWQDAFVNSIDEAAIAAYNLYFNHFGPTMGVEA